MNVRKVNYKQKDAPYEFTRSLKQTGFSILTNHPIKKDLIDNVYVEWKNFFNSSLKDKYLFDPIKQDGYFPFLSENAKGHSLKDLKEFYHIYPWGRYPIEISDATKDHTLVRKSSVTSGNPLWLDNPDTGEQGSAGDDAEDSEWIVLDIDTWNNLGFHDMDGEDEGCTLNGDVNSDGILNVLDVVQIVSAIVDSATDGLECADMNGDDIVNVLDIVQIVSTITGNRSYDADSATLDISDNMLTLKSNGYIGGVQLTLKHNQNFELNLDNSHLTFE